MWLTWVSFPSSHIIPWACQAWFLKLVPGVTPELKDVARNNNNKKDAHTENKWDYLVVVVWVGIESHIQGSQRLPCFYLVSVQGWSLSWWRGLWGLLSAKGQSRCFLMQSICFFHLSHLPDSEFWLRAVCCPLPGTTFVWTITENKYTSHVNHNIQTSWPKENSSVSWEGHTCASVMLITTVGLRTKSLFYCDYKLQEPGGTGEKIKGKNAFSPSPGSVCSDN